MNTKSLLATLALAASLLALLFACSKDEDPAPPEVTATAFSHTIDENPAASTSLGTFSATTSNGTLAYALSDEAPAGALAIDPASGALTVKDAALFDFEVNPTIKAIGTATAEGVSQSADIVITLTDVKEGNTVGEVTVIAEDFSVTIDENPEAGQVLGTLKATTTEGTLSYALASQTPEGALSIDAGSGELTVADTAKFDYETNETITARAVATAGAVSDTTTIAITLKDVDEESTVKAEDFSVTIDENPTNGQVLGTVQATATVGTLTYTIEPWGSGSAFAINATTGELTVADRRAFDYETSPTVTAGYRATNGTDIWSADITVTLNDVSEAKVGTIPFITTWTVGNPAGRSITIPTDGAWTYNYRVDWGDGSISENQTGDATHTYDDGGTYTVKITGDFPVIQFYDNMTGAESSNKITTIEQWGNIAWESFYDAFRGCQNLTCNATDAPDLSNVISLHAMFKEAENFNGAIDHWDVSNINDMSSMFYDAFSFNQPLTDWDVSSVTDMHFMFVSAVSFNQPLNNWDVSNVTSMEAMFSNATIFNQPLTDWDVSNVVNMKGMFASINFNQPLNNWDVSNVTSMNSMFYEANAFNQPLTDWDVSNVVDMENMFRGADTFNQSLNDWDVSNVANMAHIFLGATAFNGNVTDWNVGNVTDFWGVFANCPFNQDISDWDVSKATRLANMFDGNQAFNQDISNWNVVEVTNFNNMFRQAGNFNQNLGKWKFGPSAPFMDGMFNDAGLSSSNYGATLKGWSEYSNVPSNVTLGAKGMEYCGVGQTARNLLINNKSWVFENDTSCD